MLKIMPAFGLVAILILLTACGATPTAVVVADPPTATSAPADTPVSQTVPTDTPTQEVDTPTPKVVAEEPTEAMAESTAVVEEPTPVGETTPTVAPTEEIDWRTVEGKTKDNLTYLGNPDAPVTIIDYSDFL